MSGPPVCTRSASDELDAGRPNIGEQQTFHPDSSSIASPARLFAGVLPRSGAPVPAVADSMEAPASPLPPLIPPLAPPVVMAVPASPAPLRPHIFAREAFDRQVQKAGLSMRDEAVLNAKNSIFPLWDPTP